MGRKRNQFGLDSEWLVLLKSKLSLMRWSTLRRSLQPGGKKVRRPGPSSALPLSLFSCVYEMLRLDGL